MRWAVREVSSTGLGVSVVLALALLGAGTANAADDADLVKRAQTHFRAGKTLYDLANYDAAIREFAAGYALVPRAEFLLNLGQAYRRANDFPHAREMFQRYLERAPADAPERPQVTETLAQLEAELARAPQPLNAVAGPVAPDPAVTATPPSPARHLAWILPTAAVVIAGVSVGVWAATRPAADPCAGAPGLGCFDLRPR